MNDIKLVIQLMIAEPGKPLQLIITLTTSIGSGLLQSLIDLLSVSQSICLCVGPPEEG